jgi:hypothetical protein
VVSLRVRNRNPFVVGLVLSLRSRGAIETSRRRIVRFGSRRAKLAAASTTTVRIKLPRRSRAILRRRGRVKLRATLALTDPRGQHRRVTKAFRLHARTKRRR